jgi:hypothetical protein
MRSTVSGRPERARPIANYPVKAGRGCHLDEGKGATTHLPPVRPKMYTTTRRPAQGSVLLSLGVPLRLHRDRWGRRPPTDG